jgi:hypothetical protein
MSVSVAIAFLLFGGGLLIVVTVLRRMHRTSARALESQDVCIDCGRPAHFVGTAPLQIHMFTGDLTTGDLRSGCSLGFGVGAPPTCG